MAVVDVEPWLEVLRKSTTALQFMGDCGFGKTTHLIALERRLTAATYVYLPAEGPHPAIPDRRPLLLDEAQRLPQRRRRHVFGQGGPLVLGTHEDLTRPLRAAGLDVLTIDVSADTSTQRLGQILNRRIEASRLGSGEIPQLNETQIRKIQIEAGCNFRQIEHYLYEQFQNAADRGIPWPPVS